MNGIEYKFYINHLFVKQYLDTPNAVARVDWVCVMKRNGATLCAAGITNLDQPSATNFINIAELEAKQVIDWVIQTEGGQQWINNLLLVHEEAMQNAEAMLQLESWNIPLINPLKFDPTNV